jgi:hypothetical protein
MEVRRGRVAAFRPSARGQCAAPRAGADAARCQCLGLVYGLDGRLESCGGDCTHTALARTQHVTVAWALVAGGALALVAAALAVAAVIRARQPLPVEAATRPRGGRFSALAGLTLLIAVWVTIGSLAYVDRVDKQAQHRQDLAAAYRTHQAQEHAQAARNRVGHH